MEQNDHAHISAIEGGQRTGFQDYPRRAGECAFCPFAVSAAGLPYPCRSSSSYF